MNNSIRIVYAFIIVFLVCDCSKQQLNIFDVSYKKQKEPIENASKGNMSVFELSRCQEIYDGIIMERQIDTKQCANLYATHFAIKVQPSSFSQQCEIESDTALVWSYRPFGSEPAYAEISSFHSIMHKVDASDNNEYTECVREEDDSFLLDNQRISTLYVLWPSDRPIPDDINHEMCFSVFDPYCSELPEDIIREMVNRIIGNQLWPFPQIPDAYVTIQTFDSCLNQYTPIKNALVKADYGDIIKTYRTDSLGTVCIPRKYGHSAYCSFLLSQEHFSVRDSVTSSVVEQSLGLIEVGDTIHMVNTYYTFNRPESLYEVVYRAADFYFNSNAEWSYDLHNMTHIPIYGMPYNPSYNGLYYYSGSIMIFDNNQSNRRFVIGTTLHEIGHYYQHCNRTGYSMYSLSKLFKESFASCNGYYVGEQYYLSKGYVKPYSYYPVVGQARQDWTPDLTPNYLYYSPIFVDLFVASA